MNCVVFKTLLSVVLCCVSFQRYYYLQLVLIMLKCFFSYEKGFQVALSSRSFGNNQYLDSESSGYIRAATAPGIKYTWSNREEWIDTQLHLSAVPLRDNNHGKTNRCCATMRA